MLKPAEFRGASEYETGRQGADFTARQSIRMKFRIQDILIVTTVAAVLLALSRFAFAVFLLLMLSATFLVLFCPLAILFTTIIFADQRGQMLDLNTNPMYSGLKRIWSLSFLIVILIWSGLFLTLTVGI